MSSFEEKFENLVNKTVDKVEGFVQQTAENVSDFLKGSSAGSSNQSNNQSTNQSNGKMGSTTSKTSSSTTTTRKSSIPPFSVAYGLNSAGKTVLYHVDVAKDFAGRNDADLTVNDLQNHLAILTSLPVEHQTLIHKGSHLRGDTTLISLKIRDGAKMMMLSRIPPDPDEKYKKALSTLEDEVSGVSMEVTGMEMQLESVVQEETDIRKTLHKQLLLANEHFLRIMIKIDGVEIPSDRTEARAVRKALVVRVQKEMAAVDNLILKCCPPDAGGRSQSDQEVVFSDSR